ncbi:MAG: acyl transferase [Winogradskyella sp.]
MVKQEAIFNIKSNTEFENLALDVFKFQFKNNPVYRSFCDLLYKHPSDIIRIEDIPFLPIQFFKTHHVVSSLLPPKKIFTSSGTTGSITSKHLVTDVKLYERSYLEGFKHFYNAIEDLAKTLNSLEARGQKTLLIGVSFALLDVVEKFQFSLKHTIVMETGGMKGRRKEMIRQELHEILKTGFGVTDIHSEYGMTELLSQAYSKGNGVFECPPWMKVLTRDTEDALTPQKANKTGGINIIDLANLNSCAFVATQDLGKVNDNGWFEIIGRFDNSDIRGCNLMAL